MDWFIGVLLVVGVAGLFQYGLLPILVKLQQRQAAHPEMEPIDLDEVPKGFSEQVQRFEAGLEELGFLPVGRLRVKMMANVDCTVQVMVNPEEHVGAIVATMLPQNQPEAGAGGCCYVEFSTEFADGTEISTNNSSELPVVPTEPKRRVLSLARVRDPELLYAIHRRLVEQQNSWSRTKPLPLDQTPTAYLQDSFDKEYAVHREKGYFRLVPEKDEYRLTWKGAYLASWRLMWPWNGILRRRADRRARELIAEFGLTETQAES